ncbi:hypothetical protein M501DRAFT_1013838 [Patellaria atrata CBS 101060]|uniref:Uncharacterized protein n=1 Tax=Patellaria atrata CBS 101060 TaxID=1346257 RepID=A0A9P4SH02_9PEZI|nr:hypothetical protein M501DRAFT_1013838 [Patellaria atrata CBS 101060]
MSQPRDYRTKLKLKCLPPRSTGDTEGVRPSKRIKTAHPSEVVADETTNPTGPIFRLFDLRGELRNEVYAQALQSPDPIPLLSRVPPMLQTSRQLRKETLGFYYAHNTFTLPPYEYSHKLAVDTFLKSPRAAYLTKLTVSLRLGRCCFLCGIHAVPEEERREWIARKRQDMMLHRHDLLQDGKITQLHLTLSKDRMSVKMKTGQPVLCDWDPLHAIGQANKVSLKRSAPGVDAEARAELWSQLRVDSRLDGRDLLQFAVAASRSEQFSCPARWGNALKELRSLSDRGSVCKSFDIGTACPKGYGLRVGGTRKALLEIAHQHDGQGRCLDSLADLLNAGDA